MTPGEGRRVGPCGTLIVCSLVRKLGCVKGQTLVKNSRLKHEAFTKKKGSQPLFKELSSRLAHASVGSGHGGLAKSKEEAYHMNSSTTGGLKAPAWHRWTVRAQQHMEDLGWRLGNCEYCGPDLAPRPGSHPHKPTGREKSEAQPPSASGIQEDQQNLLGEFKVSRQLFFPSFFFFFPFYFSSSPK